MATEQINVYPLDDDSGQWNWQRVSEEGVVADGPDFENRAAAIAAARIEGGAEEVTVIRGSLTETYMTPPNCRIALLRADGSEYGELDSAPGDGENVQRITLTPATEAGEAEEVEING